jgi:AmmeMemoRadiSam system protein A
MQLSGEQCTFLLHAARSTIRDALADNQPRTLLAADDPMLKRPAGCFVSLHNLLSGRLRGCVGRVESQGPLIDAVIDSAAGVLRDPRFTSQPVVVEELDQLEIELTVLSALAPARGPLDFEPAEHGILLTVGSRSACFLPQVARDTGWSREQLLDRLCSEKLGMISDAWRGSGVSLAKFTVQIIGPKPLAARGGSRELHVR